MSKIYVVRIGYCDADPYEGSDYNMPMVAYKQLDKAKEKVFNTTIEDMVELSERYPVFYPLCLEDIEGYDYNIVDFVDCNTRRFVDEFENFWYLTIEEIDFED